MKIWRKQMTLRELCDMYETHKLYCIKKSSMCAVKSRGRMLCNILNPSATLKDISSSNYVNRHFEEASSVSQAARKIYMSHLQSLLSFAFQNDLISDISCLAKFIKFKSSTNRSISDKFLERNEAKRLMDALYKSHRHNAYFINFLLLTGLRIGEATALTPGDIDYERALITVDKTFCHQLGTISAPKTYTSNRVIPMSCETVNLLRDHEEYCRERGAVSRDYLFVSKTLKTHVNHGDIYRSLRLALNTCGIEKNITIHSMRHTCASLLLENNIDVDIISRLLGHKNSVITKDIYLHITNKRRLAEFALIKDITIL